MQSEKIESYLARLAAALSAGAVSGRDDIVREIGGYLGDAQRGGEARLRAALADLGAPEELAASYRAESGPVLPAKSARRRSPLLPVDPRRSGKAATAGLASLALIIGCVAFGWLATMKLFNPEGIPGLVGKFNLGALVRTPEAHGIFGWILLPSGLLMAALCLFAATRLFRKAAVDLPSLGTKWGSDRTAR